MNQPLHDLLREAMTFISTNEVSHSIWLLEKASILTQSSADEDAVKSTESAISSDILLSELDKCRPSILTVRRVLEYSSTLEPEEWLLVVTELSSAYVLIRFCKRRGFFPNVDWFEEAMRDLAEVTFNYTYEPFLRQLRCARRKHPNPLPGV